MSVLEDISRLAFQGDKIDIVLEYPHNENFYYETQLNRFNLDKRREEKIKSGKGFIIKAPKGIKKDIKNQDGIYSYRYGSNSITDVDSFNGLYRCTCGMMRGSIHHGEWCDNCDSFVRYVGDDISISGYLVLKDKYWIIHPNIYRTLEAFIGGPRLNRIIEPNVEIDSNGIEKEVVSTKKDEPFRGIGILQFKERYDEILSYYLQKYPQKQLYYDDLMEMKSITFTHTISVYSSLLRPSKIDDGSLKYEGCNEEFNILANLVYRCNKDKLRMDQKKKEKLQLLYDIQYHLNMIYYKIKEILARKKGDFRSAVGGKHICPFIAVMQCLNRFELLGSAKA